MTTLVIVEHDQHTLHASTQHVVSAALQFNRDVILLVIGFQCQLVAEAAATIAGVHAVWWVDDRCYEHQLADNVSDVIAHLAKEGEAILVSSSVYGKNLLPRVAALLDVAQVSDVTRRVNENTFEHPIYAGNAVETVRLLDTPCVLTIRTTAFERITQKQSPCTIKRIDQVIPLQRARLIRRQVTSSERPELTQAKVVVSGGRGLQNQENFKLIETLADLLGGAVGASRAAVDAGFVSNEYQVGQTGKIVAPNVYIAIGISGAIQHLAGMKDSKVIVAINKDEEAPIMQVATYRLVGDLFKLVPELITLLKQHQKECGL